MLVERTLKTSNPLGSQFEISRADCQEHFWSLSMHASDKRHRKTQLSRKRLLLALTALTQQELELHSETCPL